VAAVFTGIIPYQELVQKLATEQAEPLTMALDYAAPQQDWATLIVAIGSVIAHTGVLLVFQLGQPRIFFSMARDGLLPKTFARVHPRYRTPHVTTIATGIIVGGISAFASIDEMVDLTNIGTLFAFVLVCIGIPILRLKDPGRHRPFKVPFGPFVLPLLGAVSCLCLMFYLPPASWWRFAGWLLLGLAVYCAYGYSRSVLGQNVGRPSLTPGTLKLAAFGFLLMAVGMFTIPHDAGLGRLLVEAGNAADPEHGRALWGLVMMGIGLALGLGGVLAESRRPGIRTA
jgi:basic amino acid/polyamine antiporter, APA family